MATVLTNIGRGLITAALKASGYTEPAYLGWGTGAGTAAASDTTLFTEKAADLSTGSGTRPAGTTSRVTTSATNDTWQDQGTITATASGTVTNAGCFDSATIGSGNMFVKGDFTGVPLANGDSMQFTIKLQMS